MACRAAASPALVPRQAIDLVADRQTGRVGQIQVLQDAFDGHDVRLPVCIRTVDDVQEQVRVLVQETHDRMWCVAAALVYLAPDPSQMW